jgi:alkylation response protein AidB-like acyl-CoA dehydrogenase
MTTEHTPFLSDDLLKTFHSRAAGYDRENTFFTPDLDDLRAAGYLKAAVPVELGGHGLSLEEVLLEQRRLAYWAPATALGINMHLYWVGAAVDAHNRGDHSFDWLLRDVAAGTVLAAGHGEPGNDVSIDDSLTEATPVDGGYRFTGHKVFTSLSPAWGWLGLHGRDNSDPDHPKIVHAFIPRDGGGVTVRETWDTLGVRATSSHDTLLDGAFAADEHVVDVHEVGEAPGQFVLGIFGWVLLGLGNIYYSIGRRSLDLAIDAVKSKTSLALQGETIAHKPVTQYHVAEAEVLLEAALAQLNSVAHDISTGVDHGSRAQIKLFAAKQFGIQAGQRATELAGEIAGAASIHKRNELERLYRDVRAGGFHPPNSDASLSLIGQFALGLL